MTSTLDGMDRDRHAAVRALLVQQARATAPLTHPRPAGGGAPVRRPIWRRPKLALTSAGGLIAAGLALVAVVTVSRPLPAYAVTGGNGGEVKVEVNRLEGAGALEDALREKGIAADITYLPSRRACRPGRYVDDSPRGLSLSVSADRFEVIIPAGAVGAGETFVLSASVTPLPDSGVSAAVDYGIARGPISPCTPVDLPANT
ncbi:hypothetical protein [Kineococcus radiotolerans]|uniref:Uncharacterized protein n=1 Tax=Kineococcus radiotolerans (strain ATCC BAA-149 / DSM 14245 / SRS30216) TaxID=266940 RepID=A6W642_KINRD|nr:hypothetical protein [Kineococcus radiotolerans]ABS02281.1 hypothetical protein Krad_0793 [Kineococcus radiotolerans SRS30216 = ATCC BAA-149]